MRADLLDISEVRSRTGLAVPALHCYELCGLIRRTNGAGVRRLYPARTTGRLAVRAHLPEPADGG